MLLLAQHIWCCRPAGESWQHLDLLCSLSLGTSRDALSCRHGFFQLLLCNGLAHADVLSAGIGGTPSMPRVGQAAKVPPPLAEELSGVVLSGETLAEQRACTQGHCEESMASRFCITQTPPMQGRPQRRLACVPCKAGTSAHACICWPRHCCRAGRCLLGLSCPGHGASTCPFLAILHCSRWYTALLLQMQIARAG